MTSDRRLEIRRPVPPRTTPIEQLSAVELQQELQRRVRNLEVEREKLVSRLEEIQGELGQLGVPGDTPARRPRAAAEPDNGQSAGQRRRPRPKNALPLIEVLHQVLTSRSGLTTREAADAAREAGYMTTSKQFVNIVNTTLGKDQRFARADGRWSLTSSSE